MVVAQLVEWLLLIPEARGSNPAIGKNLYWTFTVNCIEKTKIKKKEAWNGPFLKTNCATTIAKQQLCLLLIRTQHARYFNQWKFLKALGDKLGNYSVSFEKNPFWSNNCCDQ